MAMFSGLPRWRRQAPCTPGLRPRRGAARAGGAAGARCRPLVITGSDDQTTRVLLLFPIAMTAVLSTAPAKGAEMADSADISALYDQ